MSYENGMLINAFQHRTTLAFETQPHNYRQNIKIISNVSYDSESKLYYMMNSTHIVTFPNAASSTDFAKGIEVTTIDNETKIQINNLDASFALYDYNNIKDTVDSDSLTPIDAIFTSTGDLLHLMKCKNLEFIAHDQSSNMYRINGEIMKHPSYPTYSVKDDTQQKTLIITYSEQNRDKLESLYIQDHDAGKMLKLSTCQVVNKPCDTTTFGGAKKTKRPAIKKKK